MNFRYNPLTRTAKKIYRHFFPVPHSSPVVRQFEDICAVTFVKAESLSKFFQRAITMLRDAKGESIGDYLEFGVFNGSSLANIFLTCKKLGAAPPRLFGFDAFEGLPADAEHDDGGVWKAGAYKCTFEQMEGCLRKKGVDPSGITWVKGWFNETLLPTTAEKYSITDPGIIFVDCDTYHSSKAVLDFVAPLIKKAAIICFDDWKLNDLDIKGMGEYKAFNEFIETNAHLAAKEIRSYNRESKCFLVEPRR